MEDITAGSSSIGRFEKVSFRLVSEPWALHLLSTIPLSRSQEAINRKHIKLLVHQSIALTNASCSFSTPIYTTPYKVLANVYANIRKFARFASAPLYTAISTPATKSGKCSTALACADSHLLMRFNVEREILPEVTSASPYLTTSSRGEAWWSKP